MNTNTKPKMSTLREQFKDMGTNALTIPNALSVLRIIAIPFFVYFFSAARYTIAVLIIVISGLTDMFDGKIARHFNQISKLGKLLDPAADKLTQITVTLVYFQKFYHSEDATLKAFSWVFLLFIIKEALMIVGSFILLSIDVVPEPAHIYGKIATAAFYIVMGLLMLFAPEFGALTPITGAMPHAILMVLVCLSATLTINAFISYMPDTIKQIKAKKAGNEKSEETEENS